MKKQSIKKKSETGRGRLDCGCGATPVHEPTFEETLAVSKKQLAQFERSRNALPNYAENLLAKS